MTWCDVTWCVVTWCDVSRGTLLPMRPFLVVRSALSRTFQLDLYCGVQSASDFWPNYDISFTYFEIKKCIIKNYFTELFAYLNVKIYFLGLHLLAVAVSKIFNYRIINI